MISKYELSLCEDYVADWGLQDALREITQNAKDQQEENTENKYEIKYDKEQQQLCISNKDSVLDTRSLLLGATTKQNNSNTIGQFGEGYKIALLVLTRLNRPVTIYNYGKKEVWTARFVNSKRYGAKILTVFVEKDFPWVSTPNNDLTFVIDNVTEVEYDMYVQRTLSLQVINEEDTLKTCCGTILFDPKYAGYLYVNGLYISTDDKLTYGYDIMPKFLKIGRDRNLVNSFNISCITSRMWFGNNIDRLKELINNRAVDVCSIHKQWYLDEVLSIPTEEFHKQMQNLSLLLYEDTDSDDDNTIFVSSNSELSDVNYRYVEARPMIVSSQVKDIFNENNEYIKKVKKMKQKDISALEQYNLWKKAHMYDMLLDENVAELDAILMPLFNKLGEK